MKHLVALAIFGIGLLAFAYSYETTGTTLFDVTSELTKPASETPSATADSVPTAPAATNSTSLPIGDPYATGQQRLAQGEYQTAKEDLISRVRTAAWAQRCRVISNMDANVIAIRGMQAISQADGAAGRSDYHPDLSPSLGAAGDEGNRMATERGCSYWQQNPDAVAEMRAQARLAY